MSVKIEIPELKNFQNGLRSFPEKVAKRILRASLKKAGQFLVDETKKVTPKVTGKLRETIQGRAKSVSPVDQIYYVESTVDSPGGVAAYNAPLIEYGYRWIIKRGSKVIRTGTKGPNPFMRPAFDTNREKLQTIIAESIGAAAAKQWKKIKNG